MDKAIVCSADFTSNNHHPPKSQGVLQWLPNITKVIRERKLPLLFKKGSFVSLSVSLSLSFSLFLFLSLPTPHPLSLSHTHTHTHPQKGRTQFRIKDRCFTHIQLAYEETSVLLLFFLYCFRLGDTSRADSGLGTDLIVTEGYGLWTLLCWLQAPVLLKVNHQGSHRGREGRGGQRTVKAEKGLQGSPSLS